MTQYKYSLFIPLFNEEKNIKKLIEEIDKLIIEKFIFQIILIDDDSTDKTYDNIINLKKQYQKLNIKIIKNNQNEGQSYSIYNGILNSEYDHIITMDGDCQNNPKDIINLKKIYESENEIKLVGGIRKNRQDSYIKKISSRIANKVRKQILDDNCDDTGCGLKIFNKNIFLEFKYFKGMHRFIPALFKGYGYKTSFICVSHRKRFSGYSKYGTISRLFVGISDIIYVRKIIKKKTKKTN